MSVKGFIPELWDAALLESYKKAHVFVDRCNQNYEGAIKAKGDTVHITQVSRPTINTYTGASITKEALNTTDRVLAIDQAKYWAIALDDVDAAQVAGNLLEGATMEGAYAITDLVDTFIAGKYTDIATANKVNSGTAVAVTTGDIAYTQLVKLQQKLSEANVPKTGRWVVLPPWYTALLFDSTKIAANPGTANTPLSEQAVVNGFVGRVAGMDVFESNNVVLVTGDDYAVMAGTAAAITFAEQFTRTEAYRDQNVFADVVRSLHLYGAKVVRPDGLSYLLASQT